MRRETVAAVGSGRSVGFGVGTGVAVGDEELAVAPGEPVGVGDWKVIDRGSQAQTSSTITTAGSALTDVRSSRVRPLYT
jgi:hypothetical protein